MKLTLEPTDQLTTFVTNTAERGVPARIWEGHDENGVPVVAFISRVAVHNDQPAEVHERFARELTACDKPKPSNAWDIRYFID
jgi:hypothetical protein